MLQTVTEIVSPARKIAEDDSWFEKGKSEWLVGVKMKSLEGTSTEVLIFATEEEAKKVSPGWAAEVVYNDHQR